MNFTMVILLLVAVGLAEVLFIVASPARRANLRKLVRAWKGEA